MKIEREPKCKGRVGTRSRRKNRSLKRKTQRGGWSILTSVLGTSKRTPLHDLAGAGVNIKAFVVDLAKHIPNPMNGAPVDLKMFEANGDIVVEDAVIKAWKNNGWNKWNANKRNVTVTKSDLYIHDKLQAIYGQLNNLDNGQKSALLRYVEQETNGGKTALQLLLYPEACITTSGIGVQPETAEMTRLIMFEILMYIYYINGALSTVFSRRFHVSPQTALRYEFTLEELVEHVFTMRNQCIGTLVHERISDWASVARGGDLLGLAI